MQALGSATEAVEGWEADSVASRQQALLAARSASEHAQVRHRPPRLTNTLHSSCPEQTILPPLHVIC